MPKTINITNIAIKDFSISYNAGAWSISVVYSLVADDGTEMPAVKDTITDFTTGQKTYLTNILSVLQNKIKVKEGIT